MNKMLIPVATLLLPLSVVAFAAKPTSIAFDGYANTEEGKKFAKYVVKCSNGKSQPISAWDNRRSWCVGEESRENCHSKQLKAATAACNLK
jgi:hypothetical protein